MKNIGMFLCSLLLLVSCQKKTATNPKTVQYNKKIEDTLVDESEKLNEGDQKTRSDFASIWNDFMSKILPHNEKIIQSHIGFLIPPSVTKNEKSSVFSLAMKISQKLYWKQSGYGAYLYLDSEFKTNSILKIVIVNQNRLLVNDRMFEFNQEKSLDENLQDFADSHPSVSLPKKSIKHAAVKKMIEERQKYLEEIKLCLAFVYLQIKYDPKKLQLFRFRF